MKTSLGIWAFGSMATRFVPGGYQPQWRGETTAEKVRRAVDGLGDLIDGYEFHYPNELSPRQPRRRCASALGGHDIYRSRAGSTSTRASARAASARPTTRRATRRSRVTLDAVDFAGELGAHFDHLAGDRGLQLPVPDAVRRVVGAVHRRGRRGGRARRRARRDDLPRAQELRAGDEDPDAEHRDDAARDPHAARPRDRRTSRSTWTGST